MSNGPLFSEERLKSSWPPWELPRGQAGSDHIIFWDFDGTLGHRPENWSGALISVLTAYESQHSVTVRDLQPHLRAGFRWHTPEIPHLDLIDADRYWKALEPVFTRAYEGAGLSTEVAEQIARNVRARCVDPSTYALFDDTVPTLTALSVARWRHRIITNHLPEFPSILDALGLGSAIDHVTNSATVGYEKPHPEIFRLALEAAGNPLNAWMVGDNPVADVLGAERAGMQAILVRHEDSRARWCCATLEEAAKIITGHAAQHESG